MSLTDKSADGVRLAKRVAAQQGCSRSQAEALIAAGAVQVAVSYTHLTLPTNREV